MINLGISREVDEEVLEAVMRAMGVENVDFSEEEKEWLEENKEEISKDIAEYIRRENGGSPTIH